MRDGARLDDNLEADLRALKRVEFPAPAEQGTPTPMKTEAPQDRCLGEIDRRRGLTPREFWHEYHLPQRPVILQGMMDDWIAMREWSHAWFREHCGDDQVPVGRCFGPKETMPLGAYIDQMHALANTRGENADGLPPLYMEGWYYAQNRPDLAELYQVPEHFGPDLFFTKWWPFEMKPVPHALLVGPKGAFTKLHHDLWASHSWNAQIVGRKEWVFVDPKHMDDVYLETRQNGGYVPGTDVHNPDLTRYPRLAKVPFYRSIVHPGELVWFPSLWLHQVESLDDTISITHNYLSANIFGRVLLRYLRNRFLHHQGI